VNNKEVRGVFFPELTVDNAAPLKNCTDKVSILLCALISSTPSGIVVIAARATKDDGEDFPILKCTTSAPHRLSAARNKVVFPTKFTLCTTDNGYIATHRFQESHCMPTPLGTQLAIQ